MTTAHSLSLEDFISDQELESLILRARHEDMGAEGLDLTSTGLVAAEAQGRAQVRSRQDGRLAGAALLPAILSVYDTELALHDARPDGSPVRAGDVAASISGPMRSILAMERVALNFLCHLSGIATITARYVEAVKDTTTRILDTRKTLPGLRALEKYAVTCGGGTSHRMGLHDAVLVKDNHLSGQSPQQIAAAVARWRRGTPRPQFVEVEVDTLEQLASVLECGADRFLLDNMTTDQLRQAVAMRDRSAPGALLEASGGVSLDSAQVAARTGVDMISVGALTHSAPALDLGLDVV